MSTTKGKTFVLSLAIVPPTLVGLYTLLYPLENLLRPWCLICVIMYGFAVRNITIPYLTSPLRTLPTPLEGDTYLLGHLSAANVFPKGDGLLKWINDFPNDGLIYWRGLFQMWPSLLLTSTEALQDALVTNSYDFEKVPEDVNFLSLFVGRGLITTEAAEHKTQRKSVTPAFSGKHINDLVPLFWTKAQEFVDVLGNQLNVPQYDDIQAGHRTGVIELNSWASRITLDIIGLACIGRDFMTIHNSHDEIAAQYEKILSDKYPFNIWLLLAFVFTSIWLPLPVARRWPFSQRVREAAEARYQLRIQCRRLMQTKRRDMETESAKHIDILSVLIRSGQFSDDGLVDQLLTFLAAGHETTSASLSWTCWLLATHPEIQETLRTELRTFFSQNPTAAITSSTLDSLPYLTAVASEQLRLYPLVPVTGRHAIRDTHIQGHLVPKGTMILMPPWAVNRSKTHWGPDAEEFKPERWLNHNETGTVNEKALPGGRSPMSMLTFLHGPRSCIGQTFSRAELKCLVASMVMKFDIKMENPEEVVQPGGIITIKPLNGLRLRLREL